MKDQTRTVTKQQRSTKSDRWASRWTREEGVEDLSCLGWSRTKRRRKFRIGCDISRSQSVVRLALSREKDGPEGWERHGIKPLQRDARIRWIALASERVHRCGRLTALVLRRVLYVFVLPDSENVRTLSMTRSEIRKAPSETCEFSKNIGSRKKGRVNF